MNHTPSQSMRRASQGSSGSPVHSGQQDSSVPSGFNNRQMPPPSSPRSYASRSQSANAPAPSLVSRDTLNNQAHRPDSSMSINSLLGNTAPSASQFPQTSRSLSGTAQASAAVGMSPSTAQSRPSLVDFRRSQTPEQPFSNSQMGRHYRSGSGGGSSLLGRDLLQFGGLSRVSSSQYPEKPHSTQPSPQNSPIDPNHESRRRSLSGKIPRPSSQPPNAEVPARQPGYSPLSRSAGGLSDFEPGQRPPAQYQGLNTHSGFASLLGDQDRERAALGMEAKGQPTGSSSRYGESKPLGRHPWDQGSSSRESKRAPESASGFELGGFGGIQNYTKSLGSQPGGGRQSSSLNTGHSQSTPSRESPYLSRQPPPRMGSTPNTEAAGAGLLGLAASGGEARRKGSDDLLQPHLRAVGVGGKLGGRASPLPQAVQGAQAPFISQSGEPSIKNELGRVFSGIGSGVGGVTAGASGSGPSTPLIASPFKHHSATGRSVNGDGLDDGRIPRSLSASGGRRSRKSRHDHDAHPHRPRNYSQHPNHHHHHHHHHHQYVSGDLYGSGSHVLTTSPSHHHDPHKDPQRPEKEADSLSGHQNPPRYDVPWPPAAVAPPIRAPRTTVNLEPLLSSVAHLPRHHLGSTLYTPRISAPSTKSSSESSKFGYSTTPQPLPRFEQRENCTFTVRVPRFRVDQSHREEICARRALWGTGVYTDDSDPVAAAIHSGFFRGAWGEDVESMLDLEIKDTYQHAPPAAEADISKPGSQANGPRLPPIPPPNQDLHITLLILPRLERYDSTVMFGIKSRKWDGRHDGMSFKVHRVDWVDDGVGRGEERGGEARRKRLRTLMQTGRICTGPALAKMDELRRSGVQVSRKLDGQEQPTPVQPVS
ncbi:uncharacterized protein N7484_005130 [Penicillium longicatenatum]|uniref:uncharacterized protein n=1 Tax=Penicillium longicatenatum TaxID=1561947 RepID=UPI002546A21A|nr:uncharacterized protein N7484_005130 [Penicillium longicatenatum]KAJ5651407.1 hypothetical protein N7484_005130 [Penicillium longicatenatum]